MYVPKVLYTHLLHFVSLGRSVRIYVIKWQEVVNRGWVVIELWLIDTIILKSTIHFHDKSVENSFTKEFVNLRSAKYIANTATSLGVCKMWNKE